jgi:hypothetical protein
MQKGTLRGAFFFEVLRRLCRPMDGYVVAVAGLCPRRFAAPPGYLRKDDGAGRVSCK